MNMPLQHPPTMIRDSLNNYLEKVNSQFNLKFKRDVDIDNEN